jgi:DNA-binding SARP family transcriptional activator
MGVDLLRINMLGGFSIRRDNMTIDDGDNRSRKVWLLLAYMIYCRNRCISQDELVQLLWGDSENSVNPVNALKTMFHRVRSMLDQLGDSCGHTLIIRTGGTYAWNPDASFSYDVDEFEALCKEGSSVEDKSAQLEIYLKALAFYQGDFLPKLSSEPWVIPVSAYFHNLFMQTVRQTLPLLEERGDLREAISLCRKAVEVEPYDEEIYQHLMRDLLLSGEQQSVIKVYEDMSDLLFSNFGILPSDDTKALYRKAVQTTNNREVNLGIVQDQLREPDTGVGAMFCDYDFFKVVYHAEARAVARSGDAVHIGLLTVYGESGKLAKRSLDICMANLQILIASNLRKGDVFSRCSVSQYIIMLPMANYEDSCMVMERISKAFARQYPHSPAELRYSVQPLEPNA